jgi:hypothetical protein
MWITQGKRPVVRDGTRAMTYLVGFIWGFVLLACFAGWGLAAERALRISGEERPRDWGCVIILGMASVIALAGPINLAGGLTRGVIWLMLLGGGAVFGAEIRRISSSLASSRTSKVMTTTLGTISLIACLVAYASCVCLAESPFGDAGLRQRFTLNPWDDLSGGYVTGPFRLLSEGRLGEDPFNSPRSLSLGGQPVLQSFALLILPATYIHLIDPGLAILTLPLVLHGLAKQGRWPVWLAPVLTLLCLVFKTHWVNASAQMLPTVVLLTLYGVLDRIARGPRVRQSDLTLAALLSLTLITLKNILVPGVCLILGIFFVLDYIARRELRRTTIAALAMCVIIGLLATPWLISSYRASGTPLYPLLGEGYWANPLGSMPGVVSDRDAAAEAIQLLSVLMDPRIALLLLLAAPAFARATSDRLRDGRDVAYLAVLLTAIVILELYAHVFEFDWMRYSYNFVVVAVLASFDVLLCPREGPWFYSFERTARRALGASLALLIVVGMAYQATYVKDTAVMIGKSISGKSWDPDAEQEHYRQLQAAIPPGQRFLSFLPMAHLLDYHRNPIHVAHLNCGISPPPGMPLRGTAENLAKYLRSHGVNWIATREEFWTPGGESNDPEAIRLWSEATRAQNAWDSRVVFSYYAMARSLRSLMKTYDTQRFDGRLVLIDLRRTVAPKIHTRRSDERPSRSERPESQRRP